jgi:hypothetical protein
MLISEGETWIVTHLNHVHIAPILIIVLVIVHLGDNSTIFHMSKWTSMSPSWGLNQIEIFTTRIGATILISRGKLKPWKIVLPDFMNCTILNIHNSKTKPSMIQSQLMAERHYMINKDESNNPHHEHVQATTTLESEEIVEEIVNWGDC